MASSTNGTNYLDQVLDSFGKIKEEFIESFKDAEKIKTSSLHDLKVAASKKDSLLHGRVCSTLDCCIGFFSAAMRSLVNCICNLFLTIISIPTAFTNEEGRHFLVSHAHRAVIDLACTGIGIVGTFAPEYGSDLTEKLNQYIHENFGKKKHRHTLLDHFKNLFV